MYFVMDFEINISNDLIANKFGYHACQPINYEFDQNIIKLRSRGIYVVAGQPGHIAKVPCKFIRRHREFITCAVNAEFYSKLMQISKNCVVFCHSTDTTNRIVVEDMIHIDGSNVNLSYYEINSCKFSEMYLVTLVNNEYGDNFIVIAMLDLTEPKE